jgi:hypothetical protein
MSPDSITMSKNQHLKQNDCENYLTGIRDPEPAVTPVGLWNSRQNIHKFLSSTSIYSMH